MGGEFTVFLLAAACLLLGCVLAVIVIRRALPILCAAAVGCMTWTLTHDFSSACVASIAALLVACWLFDAAALHGMTRRLAIGAEIAAAAMVAGGLAFLIAGGDGGNLFWFVAGASIAAMAIVAHWRRLAS